MKIPVRRIARFIIPIVLAYALINLSDALEKRNRALDELSMLREQASALRQENEALQREIEESSFDSVIAAVARERFGLVMPDEIVFYDASAH